MNALNDVIEQPRTTPRSTSHQPDAAGLPGAGGGPAAEWTLRRTGRKPIRFEGWQLIEAAGSDGRSPIWYDLNLYRTTAGGIVVELVARRQAMGHQDLFRVKTFEDLDTAAGWLEGYGYAEDVPVPPGMSAAETALPWAVLQAVQLRQCLERIEADYHALLSEVFAALDLSDPAEAPARLRAETAAG
jgi:hypothetical protein